MVTPITYGSQRDDTPQEDWYPETAFEAAEWIKACLLSGASIAELDGELRELVDMVIEEGSK